MRHRVYLYMVDGEKILPRDRWHSDDEMATEYEKAIVVALSSDDAWRIFVREYGPIDEDSNHGVYVIPARRGHTESVW